MKAEMKAASPERVILVSACLVDVACRYDGQSKKNARVLAWLKDKHYIPLCPESLSGLPLPRPPAEFIEGDGALLKAGRARLVWPDGSDVSAAFLRGALEAHKIARLVGATEAVLKDRSPSCGVYQVYRAGQLVKGVGCFTALLVAEGIAVRSELDIEFSP
jgi:uncharacterized protein YbbK (DUF523 family)